MYVFVFALELYLCLGGGCVCMCVDDQGKLKGVCVHVRACMLAFTLLNRYCCNSGHAFVASHETVSMLVLHVLCLLW